MKRKKIKLKGSRFQLQRVGDNEGDSGPLLQSLEFPGAKQKGKNGELHLGCSVLCGSAYARSYQYQDYWLTTAITEFLEVNDNSTEVKFKTKNSIYIVKVV